MQKFAFETVMNRSKISTDFSYKNFILKDVYVYMFRSGI